MIGGDLTTLQRNLQGSRDGLAGLGSACEKTLCARPTLARAAATSGRAPRRRAKGCQIPN